MRLGKEIRREVVWAEDVYGNVNHGNPHDAS